MSQKRTVREALQFVADYPQPVDDDVLSMPTNELIARTLFDIANQPRADERGSLARANRARRIIMDRLAGKRRAGSKPHTPSNAPLVMRNLAGEVTSDE